MKLDVLGNSLILTAVPDTTYEEDVRAYVHALVGFRNEHRNAAER